MGRSDCKIEILNKKAKETFRKGRGGPKGTDEADNSQLLRYSITKCHPCFRKYDRIMSVNGVSVVRSDKKSMEKMIRDCPGRLTMVRHACLLTSIRRSILGHLEYYAY